MRHFNLFPFYVKFTVWCLSLMPHNTMGSMGYLGEDGFHLICGSEAGRGHKSVQIWRIARSGAVLEYKAGWDGAGADTVKLQTASIRKHIKYSSLWEISPFSIWNCPTVDIEAVLSNLNSIQLNWLSSVVQYKCFTAPFLYGTCN